MHDNLISHNGCYFSSLNNIEVYDACKRPINAMEYLLLIITCQYRVFNSSVVTPVLTVELNLFLGFTG